MLGRRCRTGLIVGISWSLPPAASAIAAEADAPESALRVAGSVAIDDAARAEIELAAVLVRDAGDADDAGAPAPLRAIVTASDGRHADGGGRGLYRDGRFFVDGGFVVSVPPGKTRLRLSSGPNHVPLDEVVDAQAGRRLRLEARLARWFAPEDRGWYGGDHHVHAQHDRDAVIRTSLAYAALQARANGLSMVTEAGSHLTRDGAESLDRPGFIFRQGAELRPGCFVGHFNTPGIVAPLGDDLVERIASEPLSGQALARAVRERGGALIHTHPMTPPHQVHWMGAAEIFSDAVLGACADALDVDSDATRGLWFAVLNLGQRVAVSSYTDCALGRESTLSPGDRRVYARADALDARAIARAIRAGRTMATSGGPVFAFLDVEGRGPGEALSWRPGQPLRVRLEIRSLRPLRSVTLWCRGRPLLDVPPRGAAGELVHEAVVEPPAPAGAADGWIALRAADERGDWALTSPVWLEVAERAGGGERSAMILQVSNATRFIELRREFFAHAIVTVDPEDALESVELRRDGGLVRRFAPADGDRQDGKLAVTELRGEYGAGWRWHPRPAAATHFQADWPVAASGTYSLLAQTRRGRALWSDGIRFDGKHPASHAISTASLEGPGARVRWWGYGEEMPLAEIRQPFEGDHWWYPRGAFWRFETILDGERSVIEGGDAAVAPSRFVEAERAAADE